MRREMAAYAGVVLLAFGLYLHAAGMVAGGVVLLLDALCGPGAERS